MTFYRHGGEVLVDYAAKSISFHADRPIGVVPDRINLGITNACNLTCKMCGVYEPRPDFSRELNTEEWSRIIREAAEWGVKQISFAGGETFLFPDKVLTLVRLAKSYGMEVDLITNGMLLSADRVRELLLTGIDRVSISVDGATAQTHDVIRGQGSYAKMIMGISLLASIRDELRARTELEFTTVVMRTNFRELVAIYELLGRVGFDFINYQALVEDNSFRNFSSFGTGSLWLTDSQSRALRGVVRELIRLKRLSRGVIRNTEPYLRGLPDYFLHRQNFAAGKCMAGFTVIHIDPYGYVDVCGYGPHLSVKEQGLRALWRHPVYKRTRERVRKCRVPCMMLCYEKLGLKEVGYFLSVNRRRVIV